MFSIEKFCASHFFEFYLLPVNVGQATFEAISEVVGRVHELLVEKNDHNGRNSVLSAYIQYSFSISNLGHANQRMGQIFVFENYFSNLLIGRNAIQ